MVYRALRRLKADWFNWALNKTDWKTKSLQWQDFYWNTTVRWTGQNLKVIVELINWANELTRTRWAWLLRPSRCGCCPTDRAVMTKTQQKHIITSHKQDINFAVPSAKQSVAANIVLHETRNSYKITQTSQKLEARVQLCPSHTLRSYITMFLALFSFSFFLVWLMETTCCDISAWTAARRETP